MWIQELNLALACVLPRLPREQKGNAARAASSTIVWALGHPSARAGGGQGMGTGRLRSFQFASRLCAGLDGETGVWPRLCPPSLGFP